MRPHTRDSYRVRVTRVLRHIIDHLDDDLALNALADIANVSPFHFHRVFRGLTGEPIGELIKRLRLERAAFRLRHAGISVTQAAGECGYESAEAFARAFRGACSLSPSEYRTVQSPPSFSRADCLVSYCMRDASIQLQQPSQETTMDIRIERRPTMQIAFIRHTGPYDEIGGDIERLTGWALQQNVPVQQRAVFTRSYDDPTSVPPESLRSDACVELREDVNAAKPVQLETLTARRYAVYAHRGPYDDIAQSYQRMFGEWLPASGEEVAEAPAWNVTSTTATSCRPSSG